MLAIFAHRHEGAAAARRVLRGLLVGLFGFIGFFSVLALGLAPLGTLAAFTTATFVALGIQGASLWLMRRGEAAVLARPAD